MSINPDLMLALLAMDSYNRGIDAEMKFSARVARINQNEGL